MKYVFFWEGEKIYSNSLFLLEIAIFVKKIYENNKYLRGSFRTGSWNPSILNHDYIP